MLQCFCRCSDVWSRLLVLSVFFLSVFFLSLPSRHHGHGVCPHLNKVVFVVVNIVSLYLIYSYFHLVPMLQSSDENRPAVTSIPLSHIEPWSHGVVACRPS